MLVTNSVVRANKTEGLNNFIDEMADGKYISLRYCVYRLAGFIKTPCILVNNFVKHRISYT